jgi:Predicted oxidoreductases (related to aryl-alcohol dehydrogenases)
MATPVATWRYRDEHGADFGRTYFRPCGDLAVSSVGIGTYLGEPTAEADADYVDAISTALESGANVVDTAINYRHQRSERAVGRAIDAADVDRDGVFVSTKGGFVPFDGTRPTDPGAYVQETYVDAGPVDADEVVRGRHCLVPDFLADQVDRSLDNLGVECIDLYYVHNPETQLEATDRETVYERLADAFEHLERRVAAGDLDRYGVATWEALRVTPGADAYLSLSAIEAAAERAADRVGAERSHLAALQLPFNVQMADAFTVAGHPDPDGDGPVSALEYAAAAGLDVFASASLVQGRLAEGLPDAVAAELDGDTAVQRAINFARSAPGVTCALVGTGSPAHVSENVSAGRFDPLGATAFDAIFE